jgi:hypothetical protein
VISRAQRILFLAMLVTTVTMATILIRLREHAQDRLRAMQNTPPLVETADAAPQAVLLLIPNDIDSSLLESRRRLPLPKDDSGKARSILETLLESFRDPHSTHPIDSTMNPDGSPNTSQALDELYLMPLPGSKTTASGEMAVVDFSAAFAAAHPSGIEPETLTLLAILGTLHDNLPAIRQVRFLIDGRQAQTLAGHADLTRAYLAQDTATMGGQ